MPYKDLAEHSGALVAIITALSSIAAFLLWHDRKAIRAQIEVNRTETFEEIEKDRKMFTECLKRIESKLDNCQTVQNKCKYEQHLTYLSISAFNDFKSEFRQMWEEIRSDRRDSWNRQEVVNLELFRSLNAHTHNGMTGKTIRNEEKA